jgi:hypothetical protein
MDQLALPGFDTTWVGLPFEPLAWMIVTGAPFAHPAMKGVVVAKRPKRSARRRADAEA